jgi:hypothetical protein
VCYHDTAPSGSSTHAGICIFTYMIPTRTGRITGDSLIETPLLCQRSANRLCCRRSAAVTQTDK